MIPRSFALLLFSTLLCTQLSQTLAAATLRGSVTDPDGRPVPGARVVVSSAQPGTTEVTTDARGAFEIADLSPSDVDVVELHDCFSIAEIIDSEDLGIVPRGQGAIWAAEGRTAVGGDVAINPSGGLLAKGHPVGATGVGQIYEVVCQLRGTHPNPVHDAAIGLTHNLGGTGVACTVSILARP